MAGVLFVIMLVMYLFGYLSDPQIKVLEYAGIVLWALAAMLGILPIIEFKRKGGVKRGESYVKTTKLVDTGIYSVVRHPQYTAWPLLFVSLILLSQTIPMLLMGIAGTALGYYDTLKVDDGLLEKFGEEYADYMRRVPRMNFVLGMYRKLNK